MKKVLIITYYFPPRPSIASVRLGGLAKYLPEFGWEPIILTAKLPGDPDPKFEVIQTDFRDIVHQWKTRLGLKPDIMVRQQFEAKSNDKYISKYMKNLIKSILYLGRDIIAYPDEMKSWKGFAVEAGNKLLQQQKIDAIISSSSPSTSHIIAKQIKSKWNVSWIADFRDLWTQNDNFSTTYNPIRRFFERKLELNTLLDADALVTVSEPLANILESLHKNKKVFSIPNGFDPDDYNYSSPVKLTDAFTITYTGSLYGCSRDPSCLFEAIRDLISEKVIDPDRVQIRFYGHYEACLDKLIDKYEVQSVAKQYGLLPREHIFEKQKESQILLLLNWANYSAEGTYTGKVFEYLAAQRPILSTGGSGGVIEDLLLETGAGIYACDIDNIKNYIAHCYHEYILKKEVSYNGRKSIIDKYSYRQMAKSFAEILNDLDNGKI